MLTIDPRTGAVASGWSGRGAAFIGAAIVAGLCGGAWIGPACDPADDEAQDYALTDGDDGDEPDFDQATLHEIELTDDTVVAARRDRLGELVDAEAEQPAVLEVSVEEGAADTGDGQDGDRGVGEDALPIGWENHLAGVASCLFHDEGGARAAFARLNSDGERQHLQAVCLHHGIALP